MLFFIPSVLIAALTFPGVIARTVIQQLFCQRLRLAILDIRYFRWGVPAGYIVHEPTRTNTQTITIKVGTFLVMTLLAIVIGLPAVISTRLYGGWTLYLILRWLSICIAMHAFPTVDDARQVWEIVKSQETPWFFRFIGTPVTLLLLLGSMGTFFWFDVFYAVVITSMLPDLLIRVFA